MCRLIFKAVCNVRKKYLRINVIEHPSSSKNTFQFHLLNLKNREKPEMHIFFHLKELLKYSFFGFFFVFFKETFLI